MTRNHATTTTLLAAMVKRSVKGHNRLVGVRKDLSGRKRVGLLVVLVVVVVVVPRIIMVRWSIATVEWTPDGLIVAQLRGIRAMPGNMIHGASQDDVMCLLDT